jgi:hypothetical protein
MKFISIIRVCKNAVPTSKKAHCIFIIKTCLFILLREIIRDYSENNENPKIMFVAKMRYINVKAGGACGNHYLIKQMCETHGSQAACSTKRL